jgi:hypothetical protein
MPDPALIPDTPARPRLSGWRKVAFIIGMIAASLRLVLFLLLHLPSHAKPSTITPATADAPPSPQATWPVKAGEVLTFTPGDANVARWSANPKADPLIVSKVIPGGDPAVPNTTLCLFGPDFVADASQPGGTLTLISPDLIVGWRTHWRGGNTVIDGFKKPDFDPNCGPDAELLLSADQLHELITILDGTNPLQTPSHAPAKPSPSH